MLVAVVCWHFPNGYVDLESNRGENAVLHIALPFTHGAYLVPLPQPLFLLFNGGGVFNARADFNLDMAIKAQLKGTPKHGPWIELKGIEQYFPCSSRAERWERMTMDWQKALGAELRLLPANAEDEAYANLADKFMKRWNRDHASQQIEHIAIYLVWWPRSDKSYDEFASQKQYDLLYCDTQGR
jgi:hypothetical protein